MDPRSSVKDYVRLPVSLKRHPGRSGGSFLADRQIVSEGKAKADRQIVSEGKAKKEAPRCRLREGACVHMAAV